MLTFNGCYFHDKDKESSWDAPVPCSGTYKVNRHTISLFDSLGNKIGVIANGVLSRATRMADGKWWYGYMNPVGIPEYTSSQYRQKMSEIDAAMALLGKK